MLIRHVQDLEGEAAGAVGVAEEAEEEGGAVE